MKNPNDKPDFDRGQPTDPEMCPPDMGACPMNPPEEVDEQEKPEHRVNERLHEPHPENSPPVTAGNMPL